jgi:cytoskeletal protein CcmA (bactofilin family)
MWKKDEPAPTRPLGQGNPGTSPSEPVSAPRVASAEPTVQMKGTEMVNIGKSVVIKGELNGSEDLTIEGQVEGKIELRDHVLTIGPNGRIKAQVFAKAVVVLGKVSGNVSASEKVDIRDSGSVEGDIVAPRVAIADGAYFRGSIDMQRSAKADVRSEQKTEQKPEPVRPTTVQTTMGTPAGAAVVQH